MLGGFVKNPVLPIKGATMFQWRDFLKVALPGVATILAVMLVGYFAPMVAIQDANAVYSGGTEQRTDEGLLLLDILLVRPVSLAVVAVNAVSYPAAALIASIFDSDLEKLAQWWLMGSFRYAFNRPMGNFDWKAHEHQKEERQ